MTDRTLGGNAKVPSKTVKASHRAPPPRAAVGRPAASRSPVEAIALVEPLGRQAAGLGARADPVLELGLGDGERAPRRVAPCHAVGELEHPRVGNAAVLVALQPHALAARHFRHLVEREDQQLAVLADRRDVVAGGGVTSLTSAGASTFITALPLRVADSMSSWPTTKPRPSVVAINIFSPAAYGHTATMSAVSSRSAISRIGSPAPRPPGSLAASRVNALPSVASTRIFDVVSVKNEVINASSPLKVAPARSATWPFSARIQPFCEMRIVTGSRSISASASSTSISGGASKRGAPLAELGVRTELLLHVADLVGDRLPLLLFAGEQRLDRALLRL